MRRNAMPAFAKSRIIGHLPAALPRTEIAH